MIFQKFVTKSDCIALIAIISMMILFHVIVNVISTDSSELLVSIFSFTYPLIVGITSLYVAHLYKNSEVFGKAHLALAGGFLCLFLAESIYLTYDVILKLDPYPSIADLFYFMFYPFVLVYLFKNILYFSPKLSFLTKVWMIGFPMVVIGIYFVFGAIQDESTSFGFDFFYGMIFVLSAALTLSVAIVGFINLKDGMIGNPWIILLFGLFLSTVGDVWYYNLELYAAYDLIHPVNVFWYSGYMVMLYALIKHKKIV